MSADKPSTARGEDEAHYRHMLHALQLADKCVPTTTAFCVGCTVYTRAQEGSSDGRELLSTGYSRELPGNTHAEQCALDKIAERCRASGSSSGKGSESKSAGETTSEDSELVLDLYTTMEPCSKRASDPKGCAQRIIEFNAAAHVLPQPAPAPSNPSTKQPKRLRLRIARVFQGVREPLDFQLCEGQRLLREAGIEVHTVYPPARSQGGDAEWLERECLRIAKKSHADEPDAPGPEVVARWKDAAVS